MLLRHAPRLIAEKLDGAHDLGAMLRLFVASLSRLTDIAQHYSAVSIVPILVARRAKTAHDDSQRNIKPPPAEQ